MTLATVEKVGNGFVVEFHAPVKQKRVALDAIGLAEVFEDWPLEVERIDVTAQGLERLAELEADGLLKRGDALEPAAIEDAGRDAAREALRRQEEQAAEWGNGEIVKPSPAPEVTRAPLADPDGTEYPPVEQRGANHFVVSCEHHGAQRMERNGKAWVCPKQVNRAACPTRIPQEAIGRLVRQTA